MAFGILEPTGDIQPSGTTHITASEGSKNEIVLVPEPSASNSDPLNWPRYRKELLFATIMLGSCATGAMGPLLVPGFTDLSILFNVSLTQITLLNGSLVMALGVSAYLCSCLSEVYGKRLVFIFTTLLMIAACCWAAASHSYHSLLGARAIQGLGMGGFFALAGTASINDVFFVHERGFRVGLWNLGIIVSVNLTPVISGYVISDLSWRWSFWLLAILYGTLFVAIILFFPETTFYRDQIDSVEVDSSKIVTSVPSGDKKIKQKDEGSSSVEAGTLEEVQVNTSSHLFGLGPVKIHDQTRIFRFLVQPLILFLYPVVIWGCIMWAVTFTWTILIGSVASQIFAAPPYSMSTSAVGNLTGIAPFIGSALGTFSAGWISDWLAKVMASANRGVYEPEFRLVLIAPTFVFMAVGGFGLGASIDNGFSFKVCGVFLAIINFAVGVGCTGIVAYTNDVCGRKAGEAFGLAMVIKSAFAFGLTFVFNDFYTSGGPMVFFSTFTAVTTSVMLTTIPLYVFGKRIRVWADGFKMLRALN